MRLFEKKTKLQKKYPLVTGKDTPILRIICDEVQKVTPEIKQFATELQTLMRAYEGVGLAAPQIGQNRRIAAISQRDTASKDIDGHPDWKLLEELVIIIQKILSESEYTSTEEEACLSLPGLKGDVQRSKQITIQYLGVDGKKHIHKATGFNARVILHEMDHLDGVLFIDKLA